MTTDAWWVIVALAAMLGAAAGGGVALRVARMRFKARLRRVTEDLQQKHAATADQLRAAQVRAQTDLEQARNAFKRQLAAAADEPRAAVVRAEARLKAAYAEIDMLRRGRTPADSAPAELGDGFAATRPMREGM